MALNTYAPQVATWKYGFGFIDVPDPILMAIRQELRILLFPGTEVRLLFDLYLECVSRRVKAFASAPAAGQRGMAQVVSFYI